MDEKKALIKRNAGIALRILAAAAIIALVIWKYKALVNIDVREIIKSSGSELKAAGAIILVYIIKAVTFVVPASMIYVGVGVAFSPLKALAVNAAGITLELIITRLIGRILGGKNVEKILNKTKKGRKLTATKDGTKYSAFFGIRFLPAFPIDFVSLFMGTTSMKFLPYLLISLAGILPRVIAFTILGDKIYDIIPMKYFITLAIVVVAAILVYTAVRSIVRIIRGTDWNYESVKDSGCSVILDTDMGPDCDDAGALALLLASIKRDGGNLLGVVNCTSNRDSDYVIKAILDYYGFDDVPVARTGREGFLENDSVYTAAVREKYFGDKKIETENSLDFYTRALEAAEENSVVIVTIGMLNNISELIDSRADLIDDKVRALVCMAGKFPESENAEFNIQKDIEAAKNVFENIKKPVVCSGYEIGEAIKSGFEKEPEDGSPVYDCYKAYCNDAGEKAERCSWDLTAVHFAFDGCGKFYKLSPRGTITVDDDGNNRFTPDRKANMHYLTLKAEPRAVKYYFDKMLEE